MAEKGVFKGMDNDEYRALDAVSYSDLKSWVSGEKFKTSVAMNIGSALHTLVLEPEKAAEQFFTAPEDIDRRKVDGREQYAAWQEEHGKVVLLPKERKEVKLLLAAVKANPAAMRIIEASGDNEVSIVTTLPGQELRSKCRVDMVRKASLWDLKTTQHPDAATFEEAIATYAYDAQASYYADQFLQAANDWRPFGWICVSKRTLTCWVHLASPQHYASGRRWYSDILKIKARYPDVS